MPIDPHIAGLLAAAPPWPPTRSQPIPQLRAAVRSSSTAFPTLPVPLARVEDQEIAGPGGPIRVRVYTPHGSGPFPLITYFHGGGFVVGDLDTQDNIARALAYGASAVVVSVDYRLAPEHPFPAGADDCWFATCWCAEHAQELNADPGRHAVAGDSAGANMSAGVALRARDRGAPRLLAQLLWYGSCDYPSNATEASREFASGPILTGDDVAYFWELYLRNPATEQNDPIASPVRARDHRGVAPAYVGTAEIDPTRDHAEVYARKLEAAGVHTRVVRYPGMVHGFVSWVGAIPAAQAAIDDACAFFKAQCTMAERG